MPSFNKVLLAGNLTYDPVLSYTTQGTAVTKLRIACNENYKTKDGKEIESAMFIDCTVWKKQAETAAEYLRKGSPVLIEGRLKFEQWTAPDGSKHSKHLVTVSKFVFLSKKSSADQKPTDLKADQAEDIAEMNATGQPPEEHDEGEGIPF